MANDLLGAEIDALMQSEDLSLAGPDLDQQTLPQPNMPTSDLDQEIDSLMAKEQSEKQAQLQRSLYFGVRKSPEGFKEIVDLSKRYGIPIATVERNKDDIAAKARIQYVDPLRMVEVAPEAAKFLSNPENAGLFHDDIEQIMRAETAISDLGKSRLSSAAAGFARSAVAIPARGVQFAGIGGAEGARYTLDAFDAIDRGEPIIRPGSPTPIISLAKEYQAADEARREQMREELAKKLDPRSYAAWKIGNDIKRAGEKAFRTNPLYADEFLAGEVPSGFGSMLGFMLSSVLTGGTLTPLLGAAVAGSSEFEEAINKGASLEDAMEAAQLNAYMGISEAIPISRMLDRVDKFANGKIKKLLLDVLKGGSEEAIQEFSQTLWSNIVASKIVEYDPDRELFEGTIDGAAVGFTVGGLTQAIVSMILGRRSGGTADNPPAPNPFEQSKLDELHDIGKQTKSAKRAPDTYKEYLGQLQDTYGPDEAVYIPAEDAAEILQSVEISEMNATLAAINEQIAEALPMQGDVVIPVADYIADIASNEKIEGAFREVVRLSPDTLSLKEAKAIDSADPLNIQALIEQANKEIELNAEVRMVVDSIVEQAVRTGQVSREVARVNASVFGRYFATKAVKTGRPVAELFEEAGIRVQGEPRQIVPESLYEPGQDFADITLDEPVMVEETGERVTVTQRAQDLWDTQQERRTKFQELINCLYG